MRRVAIALTSWMLASCTPVVSAQHAECRRDTECVLHQPCCEGCCSCPTVMTHAQSSRIARGCAALDCPTPGSCADMVCPDCPRGVPRCVGGECVLR